MLHFLKRKRINHDRAPDMYSYSRVPLPDAGAQEFVFHPANGNPLYSTIGAGTNAGSLAVIGESPVTVNLSLIPTPQAGIVAGTLYLQSLTDNPIQAE